ncbi:MarR family winged helix-turn-helix transcriptional regulator [Sedimentibacter sp.]|uniref:MarR family winged helix-turn-helix transcriptional regulator n=2 Tax=Sedimentibacter sp. TaxID=1960295 RepID=UPI0028A89282|nr:MarR family winged helix-turn-helix transcriptional regulator [Sedimentibacter sp.]
MDYEALARQFMECMHTIRRAGPQKPIEESMRGEAFVIQFLSHHGDSVLPSEISNIMGISTARIAAALNSLERKGWITRRIDTDDRRRILVDLTSEGKAHAEQHHRNMMENTIKLLSMLGEEDAREYVRLSKKLAEKVTAQYRKTD